MRGRFVIVGLTILAVAGFLAVDVPVPPAAARGVKTPYVRTATLWRGLFVAAPWVLLVGLRLRSRNPRPTTG